jgi:diguanylate cyclase (GGDEF)-like protein/PAS domain S-box-containing protein
VSTLPRAFKPVVAVLNRLRIANKLSVIGILFLLPPAVGFACAGARMPVVATVIIMLVCTAVTLYGVIGLYMATMVVVSEFGDKARRLDEGDLTIDLTLEARGEIGIAGELALQQIAQNMRDLKALRAELAEREKTQSELRDGAADYRRMFEDNTAIQWLVDPETGQIVDANPAACRFYGYSLKALRRIKITEINTSRADYVQGAIMNLEAADGTPLSFQHRLANGDLKQVEVRPTYVEIGGRRLIHSIITDVTDRNRAVAERQIAEAKYQKVFDNAAGGIFQCSPQGRFLSANPALALLCGYETPAELMEAIVDIGAQLYVDPIRWKALAAVIEEQGSVSNAESQVYRRDGTIIRIVENIRAIRDSSGAARYYEGTVQDVTSRHAIEEERAQMFREAMDRADLDPLTGLLNHRSFHDTLEKRAARAVNEGAKLAVAVIDVDHFTYFNDAYGHHAGDGVLKLVAETLTCSCRSQDTVARFGGDEFAILAPGIDRNDLQARMAGLIDHVSSLGYHAPGYDIPIPLTASAGIAIFPDETADRVEALAMAHARMIRSKYGETEEEEADVLRRSMAQSVSGFSMLDALVTAVDNKDRYTRRHSEDVLTYSVEIARAFGLDDRIVHDVKVAAVLHDVGKIGVPDYVLRKPGKLNEEEFEAIKQHPMMGAIIVSAVPGLEATLDAVRHHHERWDGDGYPWGLRGEEIPVIARLMAVADAFSAMTTDRPYRKAMASQAALDILQEGAGTQWDPECVAAFRNVHRPDYKAPPKDLTPLATALRRRIS